MLFSGPKKPIVNGIILKIIPADSSSSRLAAKDKGKVPPGCLFGAAGHLSDHIFHAPGAKLWHYAAELFCDEPTKTYRLFFACLCTIHHTQSYKGHLFPQLLSQVDRALNLLSHQ